MKYIFIGKVYPERALLTLPELRGEIESVDDNFSGTIKASIIVSQITVELDTNSNYSTVDLKNTVETFVHTMVDTYGYLKGYSYSVDISSVCIPESGYVEVFGIDVVKITKDEKNRPTDYIETIQLALKYPSLYMVLKDLRDAIKRPHDTFFHCRRATETIAKYFTNSRNVENGWNKAILELSLDKEVLDKIKYAGSDQRHGKYKSVRGEDRIEIMLMTWKVVDKFIVYLKNKT